MFSTAFSLEFKKINNIINRHLPELQTDSTYAHILSGGTRVDPRRTPTLANILSLSYFTSSKAHKETWLSFKGNYRCGMGGCPCCPHRQSGEDFIITVSGKSYKIRDFNNCNTKHLIYLISWKIRQIQYVGRMTRRLQDLLHDHVYDIQKNNSTNVANHFSGVHGGNLAVLQGIERVRKQRGR